MSIQQTMGIRNSKQEGTLIQIVANRLCKEGPRDWITIKKVSERVDSQRVVVGPVSEPFPSRPTSVCAHIEQ